MSSTHVDDIVEAMSKLLGAFAAKGRLYGADKNGIKTHYNKRPDKLGLLAFEFITPDNLQVQLEFDCRRLKAEGRDYIDNRMELLVSQLPVARRERQKDNEIELFQAKKLTDQAMKALPSQTTPPGGDVIPLREPLTKP